MKHEFLQAERASQPWFPRDCKGTAIVELMDRTRAPVGRIDLRCINLVASAVSKFNLIQWCPSWRTTVIEKSEP